MVEFPPQISLNVISDWCICKFKDKKHSTDAPPHYYVVIPIKSTDLILCIITSKVEKRKTYYERIDMKALNGLVILNKGDFSFLIEDESVADCNQAELISKKDLPSRVANNDFMIEESRIPEYFKEAIKKAILDSSILKPNIKSFL